MSNTANNEQPWPAALQRSYAKVRPRRAVLLSEGPAFLIARRNEKEYTHAQSAGYRHERRMHTYCEKNWPRDYLPSPWIAYGARQVCQPDGLLFLWERGIIVILEAKLRHTEQAFWQTENLYRPVVEVSFPLWQYAVCEVVRWYDPAVRFPVQPSIVESPLDCRPSAFNVFILRGHHIARGRESDRCSTTT